MGVVFAEMNGLDDVGYVGAESVGDVEALVEPAVASTDDGLRLLLASPPAQSVSDGDAGCPVVLVMDPVLRLPADAITESKSWAELPVVLIKEGGVKKDCVGFGVIDLSVVILLRSAGGGGRRLQASGKIGEAGESIGAVAAAGGAVYVIIGAEAGSEVKGVRTSGAGEAIL